MKKQWMAKLPTLFLLCILVSACASLQQLQNRKALLEQKLEQNEKDTKGKIAAKEAEISALSGEIDASDDMGADAKKNEKIAAIEREINDISVAGEQKRFDISVKIRELEDRITQKMKM